ncbi:MAG: tetratricopeptide repeat protein [Woeseia sp.]
MTIPATGGASRHSQLPAPLREAVLAHESGQLDTASSLYRRFIDEHPTHPTALQLLGVLHSQRGEYETAISLMRESLRQFPEQPEVANNLGNALAKSGRLDDAIASYASALRLKPDYSDALKNLGLCFMEAGLVDDATKCFQRSLEIRPEDSAAWLGLGNAYRRQHAFDRAIECYRKALEHRPAYAEAHHNLGVGLRLRQKPAEAMQHYELARQHGIDRAELHHNVGNAFADMGEARNAVDAYRAALQRDPLNVETHRNLNALLWQSDDTVDHLRSYRKALDKRPGALPLRLAFAMSLNQAGQPERAEDVLREGEAHTPASSELTSLLAYTLEQQGRWKEALILHGKAVKLADATANHRVSYARALLASGRPDEALVHAKRGAAEMPHNQRALAYLGLCWRMLGDSRDQVLNDYERLVRVYEVPVPAGFANAAEFNERLQQVLATLHTGKRHPLEQTLRRGTQTTGDLFLRDEPEIVALLQGIKECVRDYIAQMPDDREHPLFSRRRDDFAFAASWSVRLEPQGYHEMHVHPLGWISSAYYVQVPESIAASDQHGGGLKLGAPDIDIGEFGAARRLVRPAAGRLVLFPSYMWHGTIPFDADEPRMTVAFDVVPHTGSPS